MDFTEKLRSFDILGGQRAPLASDGVGVRVLYRCQVCERIWLQDGKSALLDLRPDQVERLAQELSADLAQLPASTCRPCLWRTGGGSVDIDEYGGGEGFGFCWEIPRPLVIHATSSILSAKEVLRWESQPDVLTKPEKLRAILRSAKDAPFPASFQELDPIFGQLQAMTLRPGFGQAHTEHWEWSGWAFTIPCPPLDGKANIVLMLALPPAEPILGETAFSTWQFLMALTLRGCFR